MNSDPLAGLRDIHLPEPVSWWPPAPGWWLLALLGSVALTLAGLLLRHRYRRRAYRRAALAELAQLQQIDDAQAFVSAVNALLKRTALRACPDAGVAPLSGVDWLAFLDRQLRQPLFTDPALRGLATCHQPQTAAVERQQLAEAAALWIRRHRC